MLHILINICLSQQVNKLYNACFHALLFQTLIEMRFTDSQTECKIDDGQQSSNVIYETLILKERKDNCDHFDSDRGMWNSSRTPMDDFLYVTIM